MDFEAETVQPAQSRLSTKKATLFCDMLGNKDGQKVNGVAGFGY
jgi:hypothetical protein